MAREPACWTGRAYQGALSLFLDYACDSRYGWVAECEQRAGGAPVQVFHEDNTAVHAAEYEGRPERRPLSRAELQAFFDVADDLVEKAACSRRKGQLAAFRDAAHGHRRMQTVTSLAGQAGSRLNIIDQRSPGTSQDFTCTATLTPVQRDAVAELANIA